MFSRTRSQPLCSRGRIYMPISVRTGNINSAITVSAGLIANISAITITPAITSWTTLAIWLVRKSLSVLASPIKRVMVLPTGSFS